MKHSGHRVILGGGIGDNFFKKEAEQNSGNILV
jgi:hypothetical protein